MKLTDNQKNAYGEVMGGAIYTLADFAFAIASNYGKECIAVSLTGHANFISASKGNILYAETKLLKDGKRNCFFEVTVTDDCFKLIATVLFTGAHLPKK